MCRLGSSHKSWDTRPVHRAFIELLITRECGTSWSVPRWCPPVCTSSGLGRGLWGECLSVSVWIFFLFIQYVRVMQLVSGFYLEGIVPYVTVDFGVFVGRESFRSLLCYLSSLTGTASSHFFAKCISSFLKKHRVALKCIHCHV